MVILSSIIRSDSRKRWKSEYLMEKDTFVSLTYDNFYNMKSLGLAKNKTLSTSTVVPRLYPIGTKKVPFL